MPEYAPSVVMIWWLTLNGVMRSFIIAPNVVLRNMRLVMIICFAKGSPEIRFNLDRAIAYKMDELKSLNIKFFESIINIDFKEEEDLKEAIE
jgi:hypothetical protein